MSLASDFTREVSRLPFSGKHKIKQVSHDALRERYTRPKVRKTLQGLGFMSFMIVGHAAQAKLGHTAFEYDTAWLEYGADTSLLRRSEAAYDVAYMSANTAVTIAQTYIAYRMGKSLANTLRKPVSTEPFEAGIDSDIAFKPSFRARAHRMGRTVMNTLRHPLATRPYDIGIDTDVAYKEPYLTSARRVGRHVMHVLQHPFATKPYEVGIDDDVTPEGMYPAFEVGIDYPVEPQRRSFKEWRQQNVALVDTAVTTAAQAAFVASLFH